MITIAKRVEQLIEQWPMLKQGIELDLLNTSAVARYLKPEVEQEVGERVSEAAVLMALRRYEKHGKTPTTVHPQDFLGDMSVRANLSDFTYSNSPTLQRAILQLAQEMPQQHYFTLSRGLMQTSIIFREDHQELVDKRLCDERVEKKACNLTALTMQLKDRHGQIPGIIAYPLQLLAWRGIAVVEFISTYDELNIILHDEDVQPAFTTLNKALN